MTSNKKGETIKKTAHEKLVCTIKSFKLLGFRHLLNCIAYFWIEYFLQCWSEVDSMSSILHLPSAMSVLNTYEKKALIKAWLKKAIDSLIKMMIKMWGQNPCHPLPTPVIWDSKLQARPYGSTYLTDSRLLTGEMTQSCICLSGDGCIF